MNLDEILDISVDNELDQRARRLLQADRLLLAELVQRRNELGLTQTEVARRMDCDASTVNRIERGGRDLHQSTLRRYAMAVEAVIEHSVVPAGKRSEALRKSAAAQAQVIESEWTTGLVWSPASDCQWPSRKHSDV